MPLLRRKRLLAVARAASLMAAVALAFVLAACSHVRSADTEPLDRSGMDYDSVKQLKALNITQPEVAEILKMHGAGLSDQDCIRLIRIVHSRSQIFSAGDTVADMIQAGMSEETILALANLDQLGSSAGELEAMHLAGLSDAIILEVARHRAQGKPVLSGASLAGLKNTGLRSSTLLELVRRGVPDSQSNAIVYYRRHGASDAQILRRFAHS